MSRDIALRAAAAFVRDSVNHLALAGNRKELKLLVAVLAYRIEGLDRYPDLVKWDSENTRPPSFEDSDTSLNLKELSLKAKRAFPGLRLVRTSRRRKPLRPHSHKFLLTNEEELQFRIIVESYKKLFEWPEGSALSEAFRYLIRTNDLKKQARELWEKSELLEIISNKDVFAESLRKENIILRAELREPGSSGATSLVESLKIPSAVKS